MLEYREFSPAGPLAPFVRCFWALRGSSRELPRQRILPDGSFDVVFHLGGPFLQEGRPQPAAMLIGEIRRPVVVVPATDADVLGVRFHVGGAARFLSMPMNNLCDLILPLEEVVPGVTERVFEARDTRGRIAVIEAELLRRLTPADRRLDAAVREIVRARGRVTIGQVARGVGATERTLERLFQSGVGLRPKVFARMARFQASLRGDDSGYYDESHRIHEFRELAGVTPAQLEREQNVMNDKFVANFQYPDAIER